MLIYQEMSYAQKIRFRMEVLNEDKKRIKARRIYAQRFCYRMEQLPKCVLKDYTKTLKNIILLCFVFDLLFLCLFWVTFVVHLSCSEESIEYIY